MASNIAAETYHDSVKQMQFSSIRAKLYASLLTSVSVKDTSANQDVVRELVLQDMLASYADRDVAGFTSSNPEPAEVVQRSHAHTDAMETWKGALPEKDVLGFVLRSSSQHEDGAFEKKVQEELDALMLSLSNFLHTDRDHVDDGERVLERISSLQEEIASNQCALSAAYHRVEKLIEKTVEAHLDLRETLVEMISKYARVINGKRSATNDMVGTTIELSLIKLSLVRARGHRALYEYDSAESKMTDALSTAYGKLKREEGKMEEEEREVDEEMKEYEREGFGQIVEDWSRVVREKEECRVDLRRLGWTGD